MAAMTLYVVTKGEYSDYRVCGIFSTKENASAYINGAEEYEIEEWELDGEAQMKDTPIWIEYWMAGRDGNPVIRTLLVPSNPWRDNSPGYKSGVGAYTDREVLPANFRGESSGRLIEITPSSCAGDRDAVAHGYLFSVSAKSAVSAEHAHKLAVEKYQELLREHA